MLPILFHHKMFFLTEVLEALPKVITMLISAQDHDPRGLKLICDLDYVGNYRLIAAGPEIVGKNRKWFEAAQRRCQLDDLQQSFKSIFLLPFYRRVADG